MRSVAPTHATYLVPPDGSISILAQGTVAPPTYPTLVSGGVTGSLTYTLSRAPETAVTLTPTGTGLTFTPASLSWATGETSKTLTVTAATGLSASSVTVAYAVGGTNAATYLVPSSGSISILAQDTVAPPTYPTLVSGGVTGSLSYQLSRSPETAVTLTPTGAGLIFTHASLSWATGETSKPHRRGVYKG